MSGCCNGAVWANVEFRAPHVMLLWHGWKTFAHAHYLAEGHVLCFKLVESDTLSVKLFRASGACLECCTESSSDSDTASSSDAEDDDDDGDDDGVPGVKTEDDDDESG